MPRSDSRISVTLGSDAHRFLLDMWAETTGRSTANLASFLMEKAIVDALRNGEVPAAAVQAMEGMIAAIAENKAELYQEAIETAQRHGSYIDW